MITIDGENLRYCSDYTLNRALDDIKFEIANREYKKIKEEEKDHFYKDEHGVLIDERGV